MSTPADELAETPAVQKKVVFLPKPKLRDNVNIIDDLSDDLLSNIGFLFDVPTTLKCSEVSKNWKRLFTDNLFWDHFINSENSDSKVVIETHSNLSNRQLFFQFRITRSPRYDNITQKDINSVIYYINWQRETNYNFPLLKHLLPINPNQREIYDPLKSGDLTIISEDEFQINLILDWSGKKMVTISRKEFLEYCNLGRELENQAQNCSFHDSRDF